jgi:hypothetical protein
MEQSTSDNSETILLLRPKIGIDGNEVKLDEHGELPNI